MPSYSVFSPEATENNVRTAQEAIARGDLQHAFFHISSALTSDPLNREWRAILDDVIRRVPDAEVFARQDQAKFDFITVAGRAYLRAARHDFVLCARERRRTTVNEMSARHSTLTRA